MSGLEAGPGTRTSGAADEQQAPRPRWRRRARRSRSERWITVRATLLGVVLTTTGTGLWWAAWRILRDALASS